MKFTNEAWRTTVKYGAFVKSFHKHSWRETNCKHIKTSTRQNHIILCFPRAIATVVSAEDVPGTPEKSPRGTPVSTPTDILRRDSKPGRKSKFTGTDDLIIAQEVFASEAHVAPHGEALSSSETAALKANANPNFTHKVTGKHIQDRFKKLLDQYAKRNGQDSVHSGVGGEIGELDELLGDILKAKRDLGARKDGHMKERADQERQKIAAGQDLVLNALRGKKDVNRR